MKLFHFVIFALSVLRIFATPIAEERKKLSLFDEINKIYEDIQLPPDEIETIKSEEITDAEEVRNSDIEDDSYSTTTEQYSEVEQTENVFTFEEVTVTEVNIDENLIKKDLESRFKEVFNGDSASEASIVSDTKSNESVSDPLALYTNSGFNAKSIINDHDEDDICEDVNTATDDNLNENRNIVITDSPVSEGVTQSSVGTSGFTIPTQVVSSTTTTPIDDRNSSDHVNIINNLGNVEKPETSSATTVKLEDKNFYFTSRKEDQQANLPEATTIISGEELITADRIKDQETANRIGSTESTIEEDQNRSIGSFTIKPDQDIGVDITNARTLKYEENNRNSITNSFPQANFASFGQKKLFQNRLNQPTFGYNGFNSFNPEISTTTLKANIFPNNFNYNGFNFAITPGYNQGLTTVSTVKPSIVEPTISTYTTSSETTLDLNPSSQYDLFNGIQTTPPAEVISTPESRIAEEIPVKPEIINPNLKIELFSKTGDQESKLPIQDGLASTILPPKEDSGIATSSQGLVKAKFSGQLSFDNLSDSKPRKGSFFNFQNLGSFNLAAISRSTVSAPVQKFIKPEPPRPVIKQLRDGKPNFSLGLIDKYTSSELKIDTINLGKTGSINRFDNSAKTRLFNGFHIYTPTFAKFLKK